MEDLLPILERALSALLEASPPIGGEAAPSVRESLDFPRERGRGDLSISAPLRLWKLVGVPPRRIAEDLGRRILADPEGARAFHRADVAGPGFLNLSLAPARLEAALAGIHRLGDGFGRTDLGQGRRVLLEFASANPTGPLHVAHGRQAAIGDVLGNVLAWAGFSVAREYYLNDCGNQVDMLGRSILCRVREAGGEAVEFPENGYHGEYVKEIAAEIVRSGGGRRLPGGDAAAVEALAAQGVETLLACIRRDLDRFRVRFDSWFSQKALEASGGPGKVVEALRARGLVAEEDGAIVMRTTALGDEKDRVLVKRDGEFAYRTPDLAYHLDKFRRGYGMVIDLFGPDHHGHIRFLEQGLAALGEDASRLKPRIVQHCRLLSGGQEVKMSKRTGSFVTLAEILDEVGVDAARFFFVMRKMDAHLDFDLDVAKRQSKDNPVYYVQYAHARTCQVFAKARERGFPDPGPEAPDLSVLNDEERWIASILARFPWVVRRAAETLEPHRIPLYLQDVAEAFHGYYQAEEEGRPRYEIVHEDPRIRAARLAWAKAIRTVLRNGLSILGLTAPERM